MIGRIASACLAALTLAGCTATHCVLGHCYEYGRWTTEPDMNPDERAYVVDEVRLQHPLTGEVVACAPRGKRKALALQIEERTNCIQQYLGQGYTR
jgi:hypothetical protein